MFKISFDENDTHTEHTNPKKMFKHDGDSGR